MKIGFFVFLFDFRLISCTREDENKQFTLLTEQNNKNSIHFAKIQFYFADFGAGA